MCQATFNVMKELVTVSIMLVDDCEDNEIVQRLETKAATLEVSGCYQDHHSSQRQGGFRHP